MKPTTEASKYYIRLIARPDRWIGGQRDWPVSPALASPSDRGCLPDLDAQHGDGSAVDTFDRERRRFALLPAAHHVKQREVMVRCRDGEQRARSELLVLDERLVISRQHHMPGFGFKTNGPLVRIGHMPSPGVSVQVVDQVSAA